MLGLALGGLRLEAQELLLSKAVKNWCTLCGLKGLLNMVELIKEGQ